MRYKHRTPKYVPNFRTENNHRITWNEIKKVIDEKGSISGIHMDSLSMKHGKGLNRGNTKYAGYLIKDGLVVPV